MLKASAYGALLALTLWGAPALAAGDPSRRAEVDVRQAPWNALVRVQTNLAGRCTGTLVAPTVVLTAAHCLFNKRTQAMLRAESLHVPAGYDRGKYAAHLRVKRVSLSPQYDGARPFVGLRDDWALLDPRRFGAGGHHAAAGGAAGPRSGRTGGFAGFSP